MKHVIGIVLLFIGTQVSAQTDIQMVHIDGSGINVRDTVYVLKKISVNVPNTGKLQIQLQGYSRISKGDLILFQVNKNPEIIQGNSNLLKSHYGVADKRFVSLSNSYSVEKGQHDFYAIASNVLERNGTGEITFTGDLKAEFFPDDNPEISLYDQQITQSKVDMLDTSIVLGKLSFNSVKGGTVVAQMNGFCESLPEDQVLLNIVKGKEKINSHAMNFYLETINESVKGNGFTIKKVFHIKQENHEFYLTGKILDIPEKIEHGKASVYGNFSAKYVGKDEETKLFSNGEGQRNPTPENHGVFWVDFDVKSPGKLLVSASSQFQVDIGEGFKISITGNKKEHGHRPIGLTSFSNDLRIMYSQDILLDINPGEHEFYTIVTGNDKIKTSSIWYSSFYAVYIPEPSSSLLAAAQPSKENLLTISQVNTGHILLQFNDGAKSPHHLTIHDIKGNVVAQKTGINQKVVKIDMNDNLPGAYWVKISIGNKSYQKTFIYR